MKTLLICAYLGLSGSWIVHQYDAVYLSLAFLLALGPPRGLVEELRRRPFLCAFLALGLASAGWSDHPAMAALQAWKWTALTLLAVRLSLDYEPEECVALIRCVIGLRLLLALLCMAAIPSQAHYLGEWRGIDLHKNYLAMTCVLGIVLSTVAGAGAPGWFRALLFLASGGLLVAVQAMTSSLALLVVLPIGIALCAGWNPNSGTAALVLAVSTIIGLLTTNMAGPVLGWFGKDLSLTGRTEIYHYALRAIRQRPFVGYGFDCDWVGDIRAYHAHNLTLTAAIRLGLVGAWLLLADFAQSMLLAWGRALEQRNVGQIWPALYLTALLVMGLTESVPLTNNVLLWVIYVACCPRAQAD